MMHTSRITNRSDTRYSLHHQKTRMSTKEALRDACEFAIMDGVMVRRRGPP